MTLHDALTHVVAAALESGAARVTAYPHWATVSVAYAGASPEDANRLLRALGATDARVNHDPAFLGYTDAAVDVEGVTVHVTVTHHGKPTAVTGRVA